MQYQVVPGRVAAARILDAHGAYHAFFGAGLSAEAGVPMASHICDDIARRQLRIAGFGDAPDPNAEEARSWLTEHLDWDRLDERYAKCIRTQYANPADRVDYFRRVLAGVGPSFAHHGAALLMHEGIIGRTCLTTNFDKLLENAFAVQGKSECQPLRTESEVQYWRPDQERCFCLKLHGDYDTHNVLNTSEETVRIDEALRSRAARLLEHHGLLVLGLAGYEKSVYSFFEDLTTHHFEKFGALDRGLLWGVHVGPKPALAWTDQRAAQAVRSAIDGGSVGPEIRKMMTRLSTANVQFAFFPVFGSGSFLMDLIEGTGRRALVGQAEPLLDHEMRLRRVFAGARLSPATVEEHIKNLKRAQSRVTGSSEHLRVERAFGVSSGGREVWVAYGDISSRTYLGDKSFGASVRAVVSPDDTFLSVGGGVAVALAEKAGMRSTLHEVSKFVPVPQGESRVTSGGLLPVHYILHAATIQVSDSGYQVCAPDVTRTSRDLLRRSSALGVEVLSIPLLGAGVAGLSPEDSLRSLLEGYRDESPAGVPATVVFVIFREAQLPRGTARRLVEEVLMPADAKWSTDAWPDAARHGGVSGD